MDIDPPLFGFARELSRLVNAIENREPVLVLGARGSGKTSLIRSAMAQSGRGAVYAPSASVLHACLINLAQALASAEHRRTIELLGPAAELQRSLRAATSMNLKGVLWAAIEQEPVMIILDQIQGAGARNYRFWQRVFHTKGVGMIAAARNYRCLGALGRLFWDPRLTLNIPALTQSEALALFDSLVELLKIGHLDVAEFRKQVLDSARGNPGEIVEMCKLASNPQYQHGSRVKFAPLRIDTIAKLGAIH